MSIPLALAIVTAKASHEQLNELIIALSDCEVHDDEDHEDIDDSLTLLPSKDVSTYQDNDLQATRVPLASNFSNEWAGATVVDAEAFVKELWKKHRGGSLDNIKDFVIVDDQCLEKKEVIVCHWTYQDEDDGDADCKLDGEHLVGSKKVRLPWDQVNDFLVNMELANMDFGDWVKEDQTGPGWYTWCGPF